MIGASYLAALLLSTGCMLLLDWRYQLFFFHHAASAAMVTAAGTVFFLLWDVAGIALGIFLEGGSRYATGIMLGPEMPLEEPFFLVFLVICTMVLYTGARAVLTAGSTRHSTRRHAGHSTYRRTAHSTRGGQP